MHDWKNVLLKLRKNFPVILRRPNVTEVCITTHIYSKTELNLVPLNIVDWEKKMLRNL